MDVYEVIGCLNDLLSCILEKQRSYVLEKTEKHSDDQVVSSKQTI